MFEYNIETIYEIIFMLYYEFITNKFDSLNHCLFIYKVLYST